MMRSADHSPPQSPAPAYVSFYDDDPDSTAGGTTMSSCRSCGSSHPHGIITDWAQGDRVCTMCGVVHEEMIREQGPEWRDYQGDGDHETSGVVRSGLVPTDETKYVGGLQPTTLSKALFGGAHSNNKSSSSTNLRQRLFQINRRMDRLMERQHTAAYRDAAASLRRQQQQLSLSQQQQQQQQQPPHHFDDTDADTVDGGGDLQPNYGTHHVWITDTATASATTTTTTLLAESEMEQRVRHDEAVQQVQWRAWHADKWSLDRAKQVGTAAAQDGGGRRIEVDDDEPEDEQQQDWKKNANLMQASCDLYAAYQMLVQAGDRLHLSVAIVDEAANVLAQYAARRDGLKVKGVTTTTTTSTPPVKKTTPVKQGTSAVGRHGSGRRRNNKKELSLEQQQHQIRQKGSLCAAILFWTARHRQQPRSLVQVCETVSAVVPNNVPIHRVHCSKAMAELKEHLSDWAIPVSSSSAAHSGIITTSATATTTTTTHASSLSTSFHSGAAAQIASVASATEHTLRKLNLPLVAEAAVRYLVLFQLQHAEHMRPTTVPNNKKSAATTPLSTRCTATAYLVCRAGSALQQLASQAQATARRGSCRTPRIVPTLGESMTQQQQQRPPERNKKRKWQDNDDNSSSSSSDDDASGDSIDNNQQQQQQQQQPSIDLFDRATVRACRSEQQVYEIQRLWDAWAEQLPWHRSWTTDVESIPGVDKTGAWTCYRDELFPVRQFLLEGLAQAAACGGSKCNDDADDVQSSTAGTHRCVVLEQERGVLRATALATVLLAHIASAVPLIKADKK